MKKLAAICGFVGLFWASLFNRPNDDIITTPETKELEAMAVKKQKKVKNPMGAKPTVKPKLKKKVR